MDNGFFESNFSLNDLAVLNYYIRVLSKASEFQAAKFSSNLTFIWIARDQFKGANQQVP
jgi:hypothetical protein